MSETHLGVGVMLSMLGGNEETVEAHNKSIGKTIESVTLTDDVLELHFTDKTVLCFDDDGQSCCETRYMRTDDDLTSFVGATFEKAELAEAPNVEDEYGEHEVQFLRVYTSKGVLVCASHNEHNGYYGGFAIRLRIVDKK